MTSPAGDDRFVLSDDLARSLAATFGTPLYVLDEASMRARARRYQAAFAAHWPRTQVTFASKANSTLAVLRIMHQEGCLIDVASEGELRAALAAGVPAAQCHLHGNNKSARELAFAIESGIHQIVVDNFEELAILQSVGAQTPILLRLAPGVDPKTNAKISTGQSDTKFGFTKEWAEDAVKFCLEAGLNLVGYHCHVGSQLLDPTAQVNGGEILAEFAVRIRRDYGFAPEVINVGGGLGARYTDADAPLSFEEYNAQLVGRLAPALKQADLEPTLVQEPGRSLIAEAGVTLYTVGTVKSVSLGERTRRFVVVDGGLADNPRPALYGARHTLRHVPADPRVEQGDSVATVSGRHCETDTLFADVPLPINTQPGDLIQVLTTGAYNASMSSNYNRYPRPATVLVRADGTHQLVQRADTYEEMLAREMVPEDL
jgi:diaminopimelate decarboxylase